MTGNEASCSEGKFVVGAVAAAPPAITKDTPAAPNAGKVILRCFRFEARFACAIVGPPMPARRFRDTRLGHVDFMTWSNKVRCIFCVNSFWIGMSAKGQTYQTPSVGKDLRRRLGQPTRTNVPSGSATANSYVPHGLSSGALMPRISPRNSVAQKSTSSI